MIARPQPRRAPALALVSLADVAFLLVLFFMVTAGFKAGPTLPIDLPVGDTARLADTARAVTVTIDGNGRYRVDGEPTSADELGLTLRRRLNMGRDPMVVVTADRGARWEQVVRVLDTTRELNVPQIEVTVEPNAGRLDLSDVLEVEEATPLPGGAPGAPGGPGGPGPAAGPGGPGGAGSPGPANPGAPPGAPAPPARQRLQPPPGGP